MYIYNIYVYKSNHQNLLKKTVFCGCFELVIQKTALMSEDGRWGHWKVSENEGGRGCSSLGKLSLEDEAFHLKKHQINFKSHISEINFC